MFDWRAALQARRKELGLSRPALAKLAGLSPSGVKVIELGTRNPSESSLSSVIDALGMTREDANRIRAAAGFAVDWQTLFDGRYLFDEARAVELLSQLPWPAFITNQGLDLVAANRAFEKVWHVDLTLPGDRNFLAGASNVHFTRYIENFDELVSFMLGLAKGDPRLAQDLEHPAPWLRNAVDRLLDGDAQYISRVSRIWDTAEPLPHRTRHQYNVRWRYLGEHPMQFIGVLTICDVWNELSWNDWIPANAETWAALEEVLSPRDLSKA